MFTITITIIAITCLVSISGFSSQKIIDDLIFWPPGITQGRQYYPFITCGFIHADYMHLFFNMFTLYFFGRAMEVYYPGRLGVPHYYFAILYFGALIASVLPTYFKHRNDDYYRSLGASGAVCATLFAYILLDPWQTIYVIFFPVPAIVYAVLFLAYSVYMSRKGGGNINHDAHFYGALFGVVFTIVANPKVAGVFLNELAHPHLNM